MKKIFAGLILLQLLNCFTTQGQITGDLSMQKASQKSLFSSDSLLEIRLSGDVRRLLNDRIGVSNTYNIKLHYKYNELVDTILTEAKTRGHFRRVAGNCLYPPVLLQFTDSTMQSPVFTPNTKLKLVMPCRSDDYVVREWLVYKLYNLLTPISLQARLIKLSFDDSKKGQSLKTMYAIILEPEKQMALRNNLTLTKDEVLPENTNLQNFLMVAMFQYLAGNTDWSVKYQQNILLLQAKKEEKPLVAAYDFDHSGLVNAPYAKPAEELELKQVTERRYRGFCIESLPAYDTVIAKFNSLKNAIYSLYEKCPYVNEPYKKFAKEFLNDFYTTINNPAEFKSEFLYPCDKNGTGNINIRGMKNDQPN